MNDFTKDKINELKQRQLEDSAITREWKTVFGSNEFIENIKEISDMSRSENKPIRAETNARGQYVIIPANSNFYDTGISLVEQRDEVKSWNARKLLNEWVDVCEEQKQEVIGDEIEIDAMTLSKAMFQHPDLREGIDLMQTLRMRNILRDSNHPENQALLPEIEKDLEKKAHRFFSSEDTSTKYSGINYTPYSVSCIPLLTEYMAGKLPDETIKSKVEKIEFGMMSSINIDTLTRKLTPEAAKLVLNTALKYPNHGSSQRIVDALKARELRFKERQSHLK